MTTPLDEQPVIIKDEPAKIEDVKPLIVPDKLLKENKAGGGSYAVSMEHLVIRPVCNKLPTARRGTQFRPYNAVGQKRPQIHKNGDNEEETSPKISKIEKETDVEGDANIEIVTSSYDDCVMTDNIMSDSHLGENIN